MAKKRKYSKSVGKYVEKEMKRYEKGTARSGPGSKGGKVKSRKQAIAIGLSKARKEGKKVAVNKDWKLIRSAGGEESVIASNVLWFDLDVEQNPVYTDGYSLYDYTGRSEFKADYLVSCVALGRDRDDTTVDAGDLAG